MKLKFLIPEYLLISSLLKQGKLHKDFPTSWENGKKGDIIFLQGRAETWVFFQTIGNYLNALGYRIHIVPELERNYQLIKNASQFVEAYIEKYRLHDVIFIGHSKGGLIGKYFLINSPLKNRIKKLITISTPFGGTYLGHIVRKEGLEFTPESNLIKELQRENRVNYKVINLYGTVDNHVLPNKSLYLQGATNIQLPIAGHTLILEAKETREMIRKILENN